MERAMCAGAILALAWPAQDPFQPEEKYHALISEAGRSVAQQAMEEMRFSFADKSILVIPLTGDTSDIVTNLLSQAILGSGKFVEVRRSTWDDIMTRLGIREPIRQVQVSRQAVEIAQSYGADFVLFGRVYPGLLHRERGKIDLELHFRIVRVPKREEKSAPIQGVFIGTYRTREEPGLLSIVHHRMWIREYSAVGRVIFWAIAMLALPFLVLMFKEMVAGSKPLLPVIFVVLFTGADILLAFVLMGFEIDGMFQAALFILAMASALFWNLFVVAKVGQMSSYGTR
jgi:hypothetical protein